MRAQLQRSFRCPRHPQAAVSREAGHCSGIPGDRQLMQAVDGHVLLVSQLTGRYGEAEPGKPAEQPAERLLQLDAGELRAEAMVGAEVESHVRGRRAGDVEVIWIGEYGGVAVGDAEKRPYRFPRGDC